MLQKPTVPTVPLLIIIQERKMPLRWKMFVLHVRPLSPKRKFAKFADNKPPISPTTIRQFSRYANVVAFAKFADYLCTITNYKL